jgi:hypothetical protein
MPCLPCCRCIPPDGTTTVHASMGRITFHVRLGASGIDDVVAHLLLTFWAYQRPIIEAKVSVPASKLTSTTTTDDLQELTSMAVRYHCRHTLVEIAREEARAYYMCLAKLPYAIVSSAMVNYVQHKA